MSRVLQEEVFLQADLFLPTKFLGISISVSLPVLPACAGEAGDTHKTQARLGMLVAKIGEAGKRFEYGPVLILRGLIDVAG